MYYKNKFHTVAVLFIAFVFSSLTINSQAREFVSTKKSTNVKPSSPSQFELLVQKIYNEKFPTSDISSLVKPFKKSSKQVGRKRLPTRVVVNIPKTPGKKATKTNPYQTLKLKKAYDNAPKGKKKITPPSVYDKVPVKKSNTYQTLNLKKQNTYDNVNSKLTTGVKSKTLNNYDIAPKGKKKITPPSVYDKVPVKKSNTYQTLNLKKQNTYDNVNSKLTTGIKSKTLNNYDIAPAKGKKKITPPSVYDKVPTKKNNTYQKLNLKKNPYDNFTTPLSKVKSNSTLPSRQLNFNKNTSLVSNPYGKFPTSLKNKYRNQNNQYVNAPRPKSQQYRQPPSPPKGFKRAPKIGENYYTIPKSKNKNATPRVISSKNKLKTTKSKNARANKIKNYKKAEASKKKRTKKG